MACENLAPHELLNIGAAYPKVCGQTHRTSTRFRYPPYIKKQQQEFKACVCGFPSSLRNIKFFRHVLYLFALFHHSCTECKPVRWFIIQHDSVPENVFLRSFGASKGGRQLTLPFRAIRTHSMSAFSTPEKYLHRNDELAAPSFVGTATTSPHAANPDSRRATQLTGLEATKLFPEN